MDGLLIYKNHATRWIKCTDKPFHEEPVYLENPQPYNQDTVNTGDCHIARRFFVAVAKPKNDIIIFMED